MKKAVILVSGGIDSATVLALIQKTGYEIYALTFNYSQRHQLELSKVNELIKGYKVKQHKIINIDLRAFGGSALTDSKIDVTKYSSVEEIKDEVPLTYVPARNTIFLSHALGFAEVIKAYDIFIGVHATDSNYPDCRLEYIKSFENMANLATAEGVAGKKFQIHAPLIDMTKSEIVRTGLEYGVDYSKTLSCYDPTPKGESCKYCISCIIRLKAFADNNTKDPILYKD